MIHAVPVFRGCFTTGRFLTRFDPILPSYTHRLLRALLRAGLTGFKTLA